MTRIRTWSLGTAALFIVILLASWFFLVSPKKSEAADIQARTQAQLDSNNELRRKLVVLQEQSTKLADQEARLAAIRQHLPATVAEASIIRSLADAATASGVTLTSVAPAEPAPAVAASAGQSAGIAPGTLMLVRLDIGASGTYYNLERFLDKIENLKRSYLVTGFTIGIDPTKTTGVKLGDVSIAIQGRTYYSPLDGTASTTTTPAKPTASAPALATS